MKNRIKPAKWVFASLLLALGVPAFQAGADDVKLQWLSANAMPKLGGYMPVRIVLSKTRPMDFKKVPDGLEAPLYGKMMIGPAESPTAFGIILDEPNGKPSRLFVDANGNGDFTDDAAVTWKGRSSKGAPDGRELTTYFGDATLKVPYGTETLDFHVPMYRFDKNDPQRAALADSIFCYADYARYGDVSLGGTSYAALLLDRNVTGDFRGKSAPGKPASAILFLDVNHDGKFDMRREIFPLDKPFNLGGTTYEISGMTASGGSFQIAKSSQTVAETTPAPELSAGHNALAFTAKSTDGTEIKFPDAYKGKVVLVDFWATWCGPCVAEMPNVIDAYNKYHSQGFEVLGISLDQANAEAKLAAFTSQHKMPWPQVYDGKYWQSAIALQYNIDAIPRGFIVDGTTGKIIAEGGNIRGPELAPAIEKALAQRPGQ